jgi:hypothetical protein
MEARKAEATLRSCNLIYSIFGNGNTVFYDALEHLRRAVSEVTHHDGITGTSKRYVVYDYYIKELIKASKACHDQMASALSTFTKSSVNFEPVQKVDSTIPTIVYNNLSWKRSSLVSLELAAGVTNVCVTDSNGAKIPSQITNFSFQEDKMRRAKAQRISSRNDEIPIAQRVSLKKNTLLFTAPDVPAVGFSTFFVSHCNTAQLPVQIKTDEFSITNDHVTLSFCKKNGKLPLVVCKYKRGSIETPINIDYLAYTGMAQYGQQNSGAYIFNPQSTNAESITNQQYITILHQGPCHIVEQNVTSYIQHKFTLCPNDDHVSYSINAMGVLAGKEIVTRISTSSINNNRVLYCDKNGLETRKKEYKTTNGPDTSTLAANFIPMVTSCFIRDPSTLQMTLLTSQPQAVSSTINGAMEIFVYRRTTIDDGRGLGEELVDATPYTFSMLLMIDKIAEPSTTMIVYPRKTIEHNNPLIIASGNAITDVSSYSGVRTFDSKVHFSDDVHLLSLDSVYNRNNTRVHHTIIRLQNLVNTDKTVSIADLLKSNDWVLADETTLSTSKRINADVSDIVIIPAGQIRTFIAVKKDVLPAYRYGLLSIEAGIPTIAPAPTTTTPAPTTTTTTAVPTTTTTKAPITTTTNAPVSTIVAFAQPQYGLAWFFSITLFLVTLAVISALCCVNTVFVMSSRTFFTDILRMRSQSRSNTWEEEEEELSDDEPRVVERL